MPKAQSENRKKAKEIFDEHDGQISNREIASILGCSEKTVSGWKCKDKWLGNNQSTPKKSDWSTPKKRGGQPGNQNAKGKNLGNQNAMKHGLFAKYIPDDLKEIMEITPDDSLEVAWYAIKLQFARVIHAQQIMHVLDKDDKTTELTFKGDALGYEIQQAWDKEASNLKAQSRVMGTLMSMIKGYEELLHKNWDAIDETQKARLAQIKAQTEKIKTENEQDEIQEDDGFIEAIKDVDTGAWSDEEV